MKNVGARLRELRLAIGLSREEIGEQGFCSTGGWTNIENGQREPSEELLRRFTAWLLEKDYLRILAAAALLDELLSLKYLKSRSSFLRETVAMRIKYSALGGPSEQLIEER